LPVSEMRKALPAALSSLLRVASASSFSKSAT
jgi:hypothetical protein